MLIIRKQHFEKFSSSDQLNFVHDFDDRYSSLRMAVVNPDSFLYMPRSFYGSDVEELFWPDYDPSKSNINSNSNIFHEAIHAQGSPIKLGGWSTACLSLTISELLRDTTKMKKRR